MQENEDMFKKFLVPLILILLSLPAIFPLFHEGFFTMHDDTQVVRVLEMYKALKDGQFPVRWVADLGYGYGYPLFNFYAPLPYYIGSIFMFMGLTPLVATKLMFAIGIVMAAISMFFLAKELWGMLGGIVSAVLYLYAPYHAVDVYVRGAVGEFWAIGLLPLLLFGIVLLEKKKIPKKYWDYELFPIILLISVSYAALVTTHNITSFLTTLFLVLGLLVGSTYVLYRLLVFRQETPSLVNKLVIIGISLLLGLGLSAFFWIPAFFETNYTNVQSVIGGGADFRDHFITLDQLWDSSWGFGGSARGKADGLSFKVGKIHIVLAIFSLILLLWQSNTRSANKRLIVYAICLTAVIGLSIYMATEFSLPIWSLVRLLSFVQYPWRFLVFILFGLSLLAGGLFTIRRDLFVISLSVLFLFLVIYVNTKYFVPQQYVVLQPQVYSSDEYIKWWVSRISDEYMPKNFLKPRSREDIVKDKFLIDSSVHINQEEYKTHEVKMEYSSLSPTSLLVRIAYFPGWKIFVDREEIHYVPQKNGLTAMLPPGTHEVYIVKTSTLLEKISNVLSLFCFVGVFGTMIRLVYLQYAQKAHH